MKESIQLFWLTKDDTALKTLDMHSMPCQHRMVCRGQARDSNEIRVNQHHWHNCFHPPGQFVIAEWSINFGICTLLQDTSILVKKFRLMNQTIKQELEIGLPNNMSRENGLSLSRPSHSHPEEMQDGSFQKQALT
jgi:hypothetical protein